MDNIFIPKEIHVGFQNRSDTYTGKLAYVIYKDEKGKLRKETSWNSWRSKDIESLITENVPTEGFVLNKKAGDYNTGWNHRQAYTRVYDPRGFEFEITIENLLYILENTNSIKGKGLEGEFVYGWQGKELILIPTNSPDYKEIIKFNKIIHSNETIKAKDLKIGATYLTKQNEELIYIGKFDYYDYEFTHNDEIDRNYRTKGKRFFFAQEVQYSWEKETRIVFKTMASIGNKLIGIVNDECTEKYAYIIEKLEEKDFYSPIDYSKTEYFEYPRDYIIKKSKDHKYYVLSECFIEVNSEKRLVSIESRTKYANWYGDRSKGEKYFNIEGRRNFSQINSFKTIEELLDKYKPMYRKQYLQNGKFYRLEGEIMKDE